MISKPVVNINLEDDVTLHPNELIQPAPLSCPCLATVTNDGSNEKDPDLETIINRHDSDTLSSANDSM